MNGIPANNTIAQVEVAQRIETEPKENNLSNRFSAKPLEKEPACQDSQKTGTTTSLPLSKRQIKLIAFVATAALVLLAINMSPKSLNCKKLPFVWENDLECQFPHGGKYKGGVSGRELSGQGCYTNPNGEKFCGRFEKGRLMRHESGYINKHEGTYVSTSTRTLDQCTVNNLADCVAKLENQDCETIANDFSGNLECEYDDGAKYNGSVKTGEFSGEGCYTNPYGEEFCGKFKNNKFPGSEYYSKWILDQCTRSNLNACAYKVIHQTY